MATYPVHGSLEWDTPLKEYIDDSIEDSEPEALPTSTSAALDAIGDAVNTTGKYAGKTYYNTTTKKLVTADGATAASVWVDATGTTAHTPV